MGLREGPFIDSFPGGLSSVLGSPEGLEAGQLWAGHSSKGAHQIIAVTGPLHTHICWISLCVIRPGKQNRASTQVMLCLSSSAPLVRCLGK